MRSVADAKTILWIALFRGIGDAVLFYPTLKRCTEVFPKAKIDIVVCRPGIKEVFYLYNFPGPIYVEPVHKLSLLPWAMRVGVRKYSIVFDASSIEQIHRSRWLTWLFSNRDRVGYHYGSSSWLYTHPLDTHPIRDMHQKEIYAEMLQPYTSHRQVDLIPPDHPCTRLVPQEIPPSPGCRIVLHIGARDPAGTFTKAWPIANYVELAKRLSAFKQTQVIILGAPKEQQQLAAFRKQLHSPHIIDFTGRASIAEHFAIVRSATLFIGNNSGPLHIAATYQIPLITFAGGVPMNRWGPPTTPQNMVLGRDKRCEDCTDWNCPEGGIPCLEAISVNEVMEAVKQQI